LHAVLISLFGLLGNSGLRAKFGKSGIALCHENDKFDPLSPSFLAWGSKTRAKKTKEIAGGPIS
jgi:hypothetical protein